MAQNKDKYAFKVFKKKAIITEERGREGLLNEINLMRMLDHDNITRLY